MRKGTLCLAGMAALGLVIVGSSLLTSGRAIASPREVYLPVVYSAPLPAPTATPGGVPSAAPWPVQGHDTGHTGQSPVVGPQSASFSWLASAQTTDEHYTAGQPAIGGDGTIYVEISDTELYAFHPDGSLRWQFHTGASYNFAPAIGTNGAVYVPGTGSSAQGLTAFNADGSSRWTYTLPGASGTSTVSSALAVGVHGTIFVSVSTASGGAIDALNSDGTLAWSQAPPGAASGLALGPDGTVYVESMGDGLYAFTATGALKWRYATSNFVPDTLPVVGTDGTIYVAAQNGSIIAVSSLGSLKWQYTGMPPGGVFANGPIALAPDGTVYFCSVGWLYALSADGSKVKWQYHTVSDLFDQFPIIGADGTIYLADGSGTLFVLAPDGTLKWKLQSIPVSGIPTGGPDSTSLGADGTLYVGLGGGSSILAAFSR